MQWNKETIQKIEWNGEITNREEKEAVAKKVAEKVKDGDIIGFGSGSTAFLATHAIARKIKEENLRILAIPTSYEVEILCQNLGIPTTTLNKYKPNWGFDGADEVATVSYHMPPPMEQIWVIKGRGGAMFREKLIMSASSKTYILVDETKLVDKLGDKFAIPVECVPEALHFVREQLLKLKAIEIELRLAKGKDGPVITENGNLILDVKFDEIKPGHEHVIKNIPGVLESGLFIGYEIEVLK